MNTGPGRLPVLRSVLSAEALAQLVARDYGVAGARCRLIKAVVLDTYRVTAPGGLYVLRVYPHARRSVAEIAAELQFLEYLRDRGAHVATPIPRRDGGLLTALDAPEGVRQAALFAYARPARRLPLVRTWRPCMPMG